MKVLSNNPLAEIYSSTGGAPPLGILELEATVTPTGENGRLDDDCQLVFQYGEKPLTMRLPVVLNYWGGELVADVPAIQFAAADPAGLVGLERRLTLRGAINGTVQITDAPPWLNVTLDAAAHTLTCRIVAPPPAGASTHTVRFRTSPDGPPALALPVHTLTP